MQQPETSSSGSATYIYELNIKYGKISSSQNASHESSSLSKSFTNVHRAEVTTFRFGCNQYDFPLYLRKMTRYTIVGYSPGGNCLAKADWVVNWVDPQPLCTLNKRHQTQCVTSSHNPAAGH